MASYNRLLKKLVWAQSRGSVDNAPKQFDEKTRLTEPTTHLERPKADQHTTNRQRNARESLIGQNSNTTCRSAKSWLPARMAAEHSGRLRAQ
jgi:hypothetical protein